MNADRFADSFREEAFELLGNLESLLLELDGAPGDAELLSAIFRVMHTIKGSAGMVGMDRISKFAHEVESILSALRDGKIPYAKAIADNTLIARDHITDMLRDSAESPSASDGELEAFLAAFRSAVGFRPTDDTAIAGHVASAGRAGNAGPGGGAAHAGKPAQPAEKRRSLHIAFKPNADVLKRGTNPVALVAELRALGESVCIPNGDGVPALSSLDAESCAVGWDVFLRTTASDDDIRDIFVFIEGSCELSIDDIGDAVDVGEREAEGGKKLGEILVERGKLGKETLERFLETRKKIGEQLVEENLVTETDLKVALEEQKQLQAAKRERKNEIDLATVRVRSEKLDKLMALVGELVTVQSRVFEASKRHEEDADFQSVTEQFGRLTDELRTNTMGVRMVSVGATFAGFRRLVRDLSAELEKKIELETSGEETELDKTVIERLHDPLVHIVRNSIDHGIERPETRAARGKSEAGKITLRAEQSGSSVLITVEDDGNGLDREAIRKKAIAKGLIARDAEPTEQDLLRLIFLPGFSTKEVVTAVSGRGVGMDVVNRQMESIGGSVIVETESGKFSRFILKIPLTLAIIDGLLVRVSDEYFVVPLSAVRGCEEISRTDDGNSIIVYQDRQLPTIDARAFFGVPGARPDIEHIVVIASGAVTYGLVVDRILGGMQAVIKPLGKAFRHVRGVSGATIRGDGSIALILDADNILS
jgi:two-component system, chemotaxis family, sensor kinase CheA